MVLKYTDGDENLVKYMEIEAHNIRDKMADSSKAKHDLDHRMTVNLEEGIRRTVEWQKRWGDLA